MSDSDGEVARVHVVLPAYLRRLVGVPATSCSVVVAGGSATVGEVLDALEALYPMLCGVLREPGADRVKPHLRVFAGGRDVTLGGLQQVLPEDVASGRAALRILAAISGGSAPPTSPRRPRSR